jgi:hypothetical protein
VSLFGHHARLLAAAVWAPCVCGEHRSSWRTMARAVVCGCRHAVGCGWSCYYCSLAHMPTCSLCVCLSCEAGCLLGRCACNCVLTDQQLMSSVPNCDFCCCSDALLLLLPVLRSGCGFGGLAPFLTLFSTQLGHSLGGFWGAPCPALPIAGLIDGCARLPHRVHAYPHALAGARLA